MTVIIDFMFQGIVVSLLKVPLNLSTEGHTGYDVTNVTIGALASDEPFGMCKQCTGFSPQVKHLSSLL